MRVFGHKEINQEIIERPLDIYDNKAFSLNEYCEYNGDLRWKDLPYQHDLFQSAYFYRSFIFETTGMWFQLSYRFSFVLCQISYTAVKKINFASNCHVKSFFNIQCPYIFILYLYFFHLIL